MKRIQRNGYLICLFVCVMGVGCEAKTLGDTISGATLNNTHKSGSTVKAAPSQKATSSKGQKAGVTEGQGASRVRPAATPFDVRPTRMRWHKGELIVGYDDGRVTRWRMGKSASIKAPAVQVTGAVEALSPDGQMAVIGKQTPTLYDLSNQRSILTFSQLKDMGGATFSPDGKKLYMTSRQGKVLVWKDVAALRQFHTKKARLEEYLAKQNGDFTVRMGKLGDEILADDRGGLIIQRADGVLLYWQESKPKESLEVLYHKPPLKALAVQNGYLMVTNAQHQLRVSDIKSRNMLRWSVREVGDEIGMGSPMSKTFASVSNGKLLMRALKDGKTLWSTPVSKGDLCGLAGSSTGKYIAHCVNNRITIYRSTDGVPVSAIWRSAKDAMATASLASP